MRLLAENAALKEQALRYAADAENTKRRAERRGQRRARLRYSEVRARPFGRRRQSGEGFGARAEESRPMRPSKRW